MRPIDKGVAPKTYTEYGQARHDLAERIGYYCSYCEMKVHNSIEVEHVLPKNCGGKVLDWSNFLLSCKYCNTIKSDHNKNITDYLWPHIDNTDLAFTYSEVDGIEPNITTPKHIQTLAKNTIDLTGLNRIYGAKNQPTEADTRWRSRKEVWDLALLSFSNWKSAPTPQMAKQVGHTSLNGHYSIWIEVFKEEPMVLNEIDEIYRSKFNLHKNYDSLGSRTLRENANI